MVLKMGFPYPLIRQVVIKTNDNKEQIDENGNLVSQGAIPFTIESSANGYYEIQVLDSHTFELIGRFGDCDFISDGLRLLVHWFRW